MLVDAAKLANYVYDASQVPDEAFGNWLNACGNTDLVLDDIKNVFDTPNMVADSVTGFKVPSKIGKGSGKKGDESNPGASKSKPTTSKRPSETAACKLTPANVSRQGSGVVTSRECTKVTTTTHAYTITSLSYAATAKPTVVAATCSDKWSQACQHYSSAISVHPEWKTLSCGPRMATATQPDLKAVATDAWARQHAGAGWQSAGYRAENLCDRAEYPPTYLLSGVGQTDSKQCGVGPNQLVRWLPREQNRGGGAAHMWSNICFDTPLGAMSDADMYEAAKNKNFGAKTKVRAPSKYSQIQPNPPPPNLKCHPLARGETAF